jgi:4-hydroxy-tetrahydrodipicolinate synthase
LKEFANDEIRWVHSTGSGFYFKASEHSGNEALSITNSRLKSTGLFYGASATRNRKRSGCGNPRIGRVWKDGELNPMRPLRASEIRGNWATVLMAWNRDDALDLGRVAAEIDALLTMGVDGIYVFGSASEFHAVTDDEFSSVSRLLAGRCEAAGVPFQIGVSHMSATIALDRLRQARDLAPGVFQVTLPDWFAPADEEVDAFLGRMIEEAAGIGLVLYNPPHAKRKLSWVELGRLAEKFPELVGVKLAGGDATWYEEMNKHRSDLSVFVPGHRLATGMAQGAHGAYSNVACLHPKAAQVWTDQMLSDRDGALELETRIQAFIVDHIVPFIVEHKYCDAACDRLLALIGGWADVGERMRWPYRAIPISEAERLRPIAHTKLPEFFDGAQCTHRRSGILPDK